VSGVTPRFTNDVVHAPRRHVQMLGQRAVAARLILITSAQPHSVENRLSSQIILTTVMLTLSIDRQQEDVE
jgi:hypothetical protein